jgi:hypothetical protein
MSRKGRDILFPLNDSSSTDASLSGSHWVRNGGQTETDRQAEKVDIASLILFLLNDSTEAALSGSHWVRSERQREKQSRD